jgi:hypothetical protein
MGILILTKQAPLSLRCIKTATKKVIYQKFRSKLKSYSLVSPTDTHVHIAYLPTSNVPTTKERPRLRPSCPSTSISLMLFWYLINKGSSELLLRLSLKEMTVMMKTVLMITGPLVKQARICTFFYFYFKSVNVFNAIQGSGRCYSKRGSYKRC